MVAEVTLRWRAGPDDALVRVVTNRTERARAVRGWTVSDEQRMAIPLGGAISGPMYVRFELISAGPAEVEMAQDSVIYRHIVPIGAERRTWVRPAGGTLLTVVVGGLLFVVTRRFVRLLWRVPPD